MLTWTNSVNAKDNHFETEKFSIIVVKINWLFQLKRLHVLFMKKILSGYLKFSVIFMKKLVSAESAHFWEKFPALLLFQI